MYDMTMYVWYDDAYMIWQCMYNVITYVQYDELCRTIRGICHDNLCDMLCKVYVINVSSRRLRPHPVPLWLPYYIYFIHALHTQYNIRTDVRFRWTLCSCPQVDRETAQIHRSCQQSCRSPPLFRRCYFWDVILCIYICFGHDGVLSRPCV